VRQNQGRAVVVIGINHRKAKKRANQKAIVLKDADK